MLIMDTLLKGSTLFNHHARSTPLYKLGGLKSPQTANTLALVRTFYSHYLERGTTH